jgi:hypothetical protein
MGNFESRLRTSADVTAAAEKIVDDLLGKPIMAKKGKGDKKAASKKQEGEKSDEPKQPKRLLTGAEFSLTFPYLSKVEGGHLIHHDNTWYDFYLYGSGSGFNVGLAASYPVTERFRMGAEVKYATRSMDMTQIGSQGYNTYDNVEHALNIPLTLMFNFIKPKPFSPYLEAGYQTSIIFSSGYAWREMTDLGIVAGAGVTLKMVVTAYLGYRCVYNFTKFDDEGYSNSIVSH